MKNFVIGNLGQIGSAIQKILGCDGIDLKSDIEVGEVDVLHVCIPYNEKFINEVNRYANMFFPKLIIIHSTVPVGTCAKFDKKFNIVYSPCRGIHPLLEQGIRTFTKYFAGEKSREASKIFADKDVDCVYSNSERAIESLEAAKLWDTTQYAWNIVLEKAIYKYCEDNGLDFNVVYTMFNQSYNEGYEKLGLPHYKKYILKHIEGKIGGIASCQT